MRMSDWSSDVCSSDLRRIEQVEGNTVLFKGHHRRRDGNNALLLDFHPVGAGAAIGPTRLYLPGQVYRATFQKQFFSERSLTSVRVRDDSEEPAEDRKRGVEGKGWVNRVNVGGG